MKNTKVFNSGLFYVIIAVTVWMVTFFSPSYSWTSFFIVPSAVLALLFSPLAVISLLPRNDHWSESKAWWVIGGNLFITIIMCLNLLFALAAD